MCLASKGALGKRTHFQQKNVAQLVLQVERKEEKAKVSWEDSPSYTPPSMLPKVKAAELVLKGNSVQNLNNSTFWIRHDLHPKLGWRSGSVRCVLFIPSSLLQDYQLDDDTVLDQISLAEPGQFHLPDLQAEEQAVMLGVW